MKLFASYKKIRNLSHLQQMTEESDIYLAELKSLSLWDTSTEFWEKDKNLSSETCNNFFLHHHLLKTSSCIKTEG